MYSYRVYSFLHVPMCLYKSLCFLIDSNGSLWVLIVLFASLLVLMGPYESLWVLIGP